MRQSNLEAVRIVAMSMILIWHFFIHGGILATQPWTWCVVPFIIDGVNLFILISGYFQIRFKLKSLLRLAFIVVMIQLFMYILDYFVTGTPIDFKAMCYKMVAPFTINDYWFIKTYFILYIISPLINQGMYNMSLTSLRWLVLGMLFVLFYSCGYFGNPANSYDFYTFLCLYVLGYYLRIEPALRRIKCNVLVIVLSTGLAIGVLAYLIGVRSYSSIAYLYNYANPLITLTAVCILLLFARVHFRSRVINGIAYCALGCYLLQDGIARNLAYDYINDLAMGGEWLTLALTCLVLFVSYWIVSYVLFCVLDAIFSPIYSWAYKMSLPIQSWLTNRMSADQ